MWWIIPAVIVAVIVFALVLPVHLNLSYDDDFCAVLRVLFIKKTLFPSPPKEKKEKKKKAASMDKKTGKKKKKPEKPKKKLSFDDVMDLIRKLIAVFSKLIEKLRKKLVIKLQRLNVKIGTDEAAKTAVAYGAVCCATDELLDLMRRFLKFKEKSGAVSVEADFLSEETDFSVSVDLSLNVAAAIGIVIPTLITYLKENK